jgi:GDP-D-mannose dehydratase
MLHYGDMTDATNLIRIIQDTRPTETVWDFADSLTEYINVNNEDSRRWLMA